LFMFNVLPMSGFHWQTNLVRLLLVKKRAKSKWWVLAKITARHSDLCWKFDKYFVEEIKGLDWVEMFEDWSV
jgi:hypothetical protein